MSKLFSFPEEEKTKQKQREKLKFSTHPVFNKKNVTLHSDKAVGIPLLTKGISWLWKTQQIDS